MEQDEVYNLAVESQERERERERVKCENKQSQSYYSNEIISYNKGITSYSFDTTDLQAHPEGESLIPSARSCGRTWDGLMCWDEARAGETVQKLCPQYHLFYKFRNASKQCMEDGQWFVHPEYNNTWTNYTQCVSNDSLVILPPPSTVNITKHLGIIKTICRIGYGLSIVSLLVAIVVMLYFKKLRNPRNTLHVHLFLSFILRGTVWFIHELFVGGLGLPKDIQIIDGRVHFRDDVSHWECKLLMVLFNYAMSSNYLWIFTEGFYLHNLIFVAVFSESSSVILYIFLGWCSSLVFLIPWVIVRAQLENILCWNTNPTSQYFWIIKLPLTLSVLVNSAFFVRIVRELFVKLKASAHQTNTGVCRHRKLAKSTLVLIPLMGVPYVLFLGLPDKLNETAELVKLYFEMLFNSFNGVIVATLYCFINAEVRQEVIKVCWKNGRGDGSYSMMRRAKPSMLNTTICDDIPMNGLTKTEYNRNAETPLENAVFLQIPSQTTETEMLSKNHFSHQNQNEIKSEANCSTEGSS